MRRFVLGCMLGYLAAWPFSHHKPKPAPDYPQIIISAQADDLELHNAAEYLKDIHDNYPWLRPWAEPTLDVINRLRGIDPNAADDLKQLRHDIDAIDAMKKNTIV